MGVVLWMVNSSSPGIGLNSLAEEMYLCKCHCLKKKKRLFLDGLKKKSLYLDGTNL